ncbi:MAG: hypothetical protein R2760_08630 [Chitinophagales bacterium]|nr:hypothetical protein [Bacteroidota bacterium]
MKRRINIALIVCLLSPFLGFAQPKQNLVQFNFTEVWVWEYTDSLNKKNEMAIYREPNFNYWLLTNEAFGQSDEMSVWFLLKQNGEIIQAYQDGESNDSIQLMKYNLQFNNKTKLPTNWKATGNTKNFGDVSLGFPKFIGKEYKVSYSKTNKFSVFYLGTTKADFTMLTLFNELNIDAKLLVRFPKNIPANYIVMSEQTKFLNDSIQYNFKYISNAEYYVSFVEDVN